jgi:hypothetical protein
MEAQITLVPGSNADSSQQAICVLANKRLLSSRCSFNSDCYATLHGSVIGNIGTHNRYFGGQRDYDRCAAQDFTVKGVPVLKAGDKLECPIIATFNEGSGLMRCRMKISRAAVEVPPGIVVRCASLPSIFRPILPSHMSKPAAPATHTPLPAAQPDMAGAAATDSEHHLVAT